MGLTGVSIGQLTLIFLIAVMLFGTKRLKNLGEDLGSAIRGFQKGLKGLPKDNDTAENESENSKVDRTLEDKL